MFYLLYVLLLCMLSFLLFKLLIKELVFDCLDLLGELGECVWLLQELAKD